MTEIFGIKTYLPQEGAKILGIGKNMMYDLIKEGEIEIVSVGKRKKVTDVGLKNFIERRTIKPAKAKLYNK